MCSLLYETGRGKKVRIGFKVRHVASRRFKIICALKVYRIKSEILLRNNSPQLFTLALCCGRNEAGERRKRKPSLLTVDGAELLLMSAGQDLLIQRLGVLKLALFQVARGLTGKEQKTTSTTALQFSIQCHVTNPVLNTKLKLTGTFGILW